ncbi:beta-glucosidase D [Apiospora arundinis]
MASRLRASALQALVRSVRASAISPAPLRPHLRPYPSLPRTLQPAQFSRRYAHAIPKPSRPAPPAPSSQSEEIKQRKLQEPHYELTFTCVPCSERSTHTVSKQGYHKGSVLITCPSCRNRHVISDHLNIFGNRKITVEDLMRERGQLVKRGTLGEDGDVEFWEDGTVTERKKESENETEPSLAQADGVSTSQQSTGSPLTDSPTRPQLGDTTSSASSATPSNRREYSTFGRRDSHNGMYPNNSRERNAVLKSASRNNREPFTWDSEVPSTVLGHSGRNPGRGIPQGFPDIPSSHDKAHELPRGSMISTANSAALLRRSLKAVDEQPHPVRPAPLKVRHVFPTQIAGQLPSNTEDFWRQEFVPSKRIEQKSRAGVGMPPLASEKKTGAQQLLSNADKPWGRTFAVPRKIHAETPVADLRASKLANKKEAKLPFKIRKFKAGSRISEAERKLYGQPEARVIRQREIGVLEEAERKKREKMERRSTQPPRRRFTLRKYKAVSDIPGYIVRGFGKVPRPSDQGHEVAGGANQSMLDGKVSPAHEEEIEESASPVHVQAEAVSTPPTTKARKRPVTSFVYAWPSGSTTPLRVAISRTRKKQTDDA